MLRAHHTEILAETLDPLSTSTALSVVALHGWHGIPDEKLHSHKLQSLIHEYETARKPRILVVEHEPDTVMQIKSALAGAYGLYYASTRQHALSMIGTIQPDLILADCDLPDDSGYNLCNLLRQNSKYTSIPVILVGGDRTIDIEARAFRVGAVDFIRKPLVTAAAQARINNHLSLTHVREIKASRLNIIRKLSRAAEFRDNETGAHFERMSRFSKVLALRLGLPETAAEDIANAAPMHDIGKIGIPDAILQKKGRLTPEEYLVMQQHPAIGASILHDDVKEDGVIAMAYQIALTHHEKWDGTGYPHGIYGEEIPIVGRIVAIADVFDALTSDRPYKRKWSTADAVSYIHQMSGSHFDPGLMRAFDDSLEQFLEIQILFENP